MSSGEDINRIGAESRCREGFILALDRARTTAPLEHRAALREVGSNQVQARWRRMGVELFLRLETRRSKAQFRVSLDRSDCIRNDELRRRTRRRDGGRVGGGDGGGRGADLEDEELVEELECLHQKSMSSVRQKELQATS